MGARGIAFVRSGGLVAAVLALIAVPGVAVRAGELSVEDPQDDVVLCDTTTRVPTPLLHLDVRYLTVPRAMLRDIGRRWDVQVDVGGFGDLGADVESISDRDPLVAVRFLPEPQSRGWIELQYGFLDGQPVQRVVDSNGANVAGAGLTVDLGDGGEVLFSATGLPLGTDPMLGSYTRFIFKGHYACDKLRSSLSARGFPLLRLLALIAGATPSPAPTLVVASPTRPATPSAAPTAITTSLATPTAPTSATPAPPSPPPTGPAGGVEDVGLPLWLILLIGLIGASAAALLLRRIVWPGTTNCDDLQRECERWRRAVEAAAKAKEDAEFELARWGIKVASLTASESEDPGTYTAQISVARRQQAIAAEAARRAAEAFGEAAAKAGEACLAAERCREALQQEDIGA